MMRRGAFEVQVEVDTQDTEAAAEMACERVDHSVTHSLYVLKSD